MACRAHLTVDGVELALADMFYTYGFVDEVRPADRCATARADNGGRRVGQGPRSATFEPANNQGEHGQPSTRGYMIPGT